ncbi:glycosyltransferase family 2 protein [Chitiniphilus purpureus]|uniref:Glycosyltransferase family 2 protein n=1 Tax=Chitiniphilus purpureus TaxID=2981137 RepID=A0ABY6DRA7_9NEIS|nr:glycosyltransferase family 2 protein [Chitiniphilus sp. CD1]UXY15621.1 glycosyltransferase family 2 protein [Chitiniphilus sp. CD1]
MNRSTSRISVIIPAKNEAASLAQLLPQIRAHYPEAELIVVNDGSTDSTSEIAIACNARVVNHPYSKGNGAAIKSGARAANGEVLVFMDADGQHQAHEIDRLLNTLNSGHDMVVGARNRAGQANHHRAFANRFYNRLASWMVGQKVLDLTSGFRAVRRKQFLQFLPLLPNGFSYPTTITMCFFRSGYSVAYESVNVLQRQGKSHIHLTKDGLRFLLIIFKVGTLFSPLKLFAPIALSFFSVGIAYYAYTFLSFGRFTNMSALLISNSVLIFLFGLVAEQITSLMYLRIDSALENEE